MKSTLRVQAGVLIAMLITSLPVSSAVADPPLTPQDPTVLASPGVNQVTLGWHAVESPAPSYLIKITEVEKSCGASCTSVVRTLPPITVTGSWVDVTGLDPGTNYDPSTGVTTTATYTFHLFLTQANGTLTPSFSLTSRALGSPVLEAASTAVWPTPSVASLSWGLSDTGRYNAGPGPNDVSYAVTTSPKSPGCVVVTTDCTLAGLHAATHYTAIITATNALGAGAPLTVDFRTPRATRRSPGL
jgi:hypothetical protein